MRNLILAAAMTLTVAATGPVLAAELAMGTTLGTTMNEVKNKLSGMGYEVRKSEMEDGNIEVYIVSDNMMGEVYVSPETGKVVKLVSK